MTKAGVSLEIQSAIIQKAGRDALLRYTLPYEDVLGVITGKNLDDNKYNRWEAAGWTLLFIVPQLKELKELQILKEVKFAKEFKLLKGEFKFLKNSEQLYKLTSKLDIGERINMYKDVAGQLANKNGWKKAKDIMKFNKNRTVYRDGEGVLYSLDTQHGEFEVCNKNGVHQGAVDFGGNKTKSADATGKHNLKVD